MARKSAAPKKEKPITAERPKSIVLTEMQEKMVNGLLEGKDPRRAAAEAGYASSTRNATNIAKSVAVRQAVEAARSELSSALQISRADVIDGIMEAINLARLGADPMAMIKGWTEVGKILGHYAPEVKKLEITGNQKRLQSKFEVMSDEELLRVIEGTATVVLDDEEDADHA